MTRKEPLPWLIVPSLVGECCCELMSVANAVVGTCLHIIGMVRSSYNSNRSQLALKITSHRLRACLEESKCRWSRKTCRLRLVFKEYRRPECWAIYLIFSTSCLVLRNYPSYPLELIAIREGPG